MFPVVYKQFCSYLPNASQNVSKARVLSFLGNQFGGLLSSVCSHKIGTMSYRTKSDPYALLSHALSEKSASEYSSSMEKSTN